ncbi:MAG: type II toxin-antitoxin system HicA family toxin [Actinomycetales bacterium]|nr:type II toxin-antitoxin system HicA family toxin [Actinomycetales bacterium]
MVSDQPTRKAVKMLQSAGWQRLRTVGSHSIWRSPKGDTFTLPDGHRRISPGVYRNLLKALEAANDN